MSTFPILAGLCSWQSYTINAPVPSTALQVGAIIYVDPRDKNSTSERYVDFPYVVRGIEGGRKAHFQQYKRAALGFTWDDPLTLLKHKRYDGSTNQQGEILTCDKKYANDLQWVPYEESTTDWRRCVHVEVNNSTGEPVLLARALVNCPDCKDRGLLPGVFMRELGVAILYYYDFHVIRKFDLFCLPSILSF